ncbi:MAG: CAP domain-containing protein [Kofleriaceae bacterium]
MVRSALMLVMLIGCGNEIAGDDGDDDTGPVDGEPAALAGITAAHNSVRADVGVAPVVWNAELAALATGFIADCVFDHSSNAERSNKAGFQYIGENLYSSGGFMPSGQQVSDAWSSEQSDYNYAQNTCAGVCGHYTQQVWADTTDLGCAIKDCGNGFIVSCEYGPGGNINGQRPY